MSLYHNPNMVTNGLVLCLDAGNTKSYPGYGTTFTDICGLGNNGTLTNGPTFNGYDSRTNGNLYSNDVTNAYYTQYFVTVGASSETAPDGTTTASYFTLSATATTYKGVTGGYISYPTSSIVTISCFVKPTGGARYFWIREGGYGASRVGFDLTSVSVFSSSSATGYINAAGNGWYRVQAVMGALPQSSARVQLLGASDTTPPGNLNVSSTGTETYHIWGAQCELGEFATSPMLTTSSTVTRAAGPATLVFDGTDDYVDTNVKLFTTQKFSVSFWVKVSSFNSTYCSGILNNSYVTIFGTASNYLGYTSTFAAGIQTSAGSSAIGIVTQSGYSTDTWYHYAAVYDGTQTGNAARLKLYINGVPKTLVYDATVPSTPYDNNTTTKIGYGLSASLSFYNYHNGNVSNILYHIVALTDAEVLQNFNALRGRFGL